MLKPFIAGIAAAAVAGGYFIAYPLLTADKLRAAIEARDGATVVSLIDFESLREDLEADLMAHISANEKNPMALAFSGAVVSGAVTGFVRPEMVENMVTGAGPAGGLSASASSAKLPAMQDSSIRFGPGRMTLRFETDNEPVAIHFAPRGFGWKVVGMDLDMTRFNR